jgi:threonine/homoserine/homoserine lactone efflux protein
MGADPQRIPAVPSIESLSVFVAAAAVFAFVPGPGMLYATAQTVARGPRGGLRAALGIHLGGYAHVLATALGLSALLAAVPALYLAVKLAGGLYLAWLGLRLILDRPRGIETRGEAAEPPARRAVIESALVEMLNPKTAVFFLAFLPQFADPGAAWPMWAQLLVLGLIVNVLFSVSDLLCIALAGHVRGRLRGSARAARACRAIGGTVMVGLGLKLAAER